MNCEEIVQHIGDYLDGNLPIGLLGEFESHLNTCDKCKKEVEIEKRLVAALKKLRIEESPALLYNAVLEKVHKSKEKKSFTEQLFSPFIIRIPVATTAFILIIIGIIYIYTNLSKKGLTTPSLLQKERTPAIESPIESKPTPEIGMKQKIVSEEKAVAEKISPKITPELKEEEEKYGSYTGDLLSSEKTIRTPETLKPTQAELKYEVAKEISSPEQKTPEQATFYDKGTSIIAEKKIPETPASAPSVGNAYMRSSQMDFESKPEQKDYLAQMKHTYIPTPTPTIQLGQKARYTLIQPTRQTEDKQKTARFISRGEATPAPPQEYFGTKMMQTEPSKNIISASPESVPTVGKLGTVSAGTFEYRKDFAVENISEKYIFISDYYNKAIDEIKKCLKRYNYDYEKLMKIKNIAGDTENIYLTTTSEEWKAIESELDRINKSKEIAKHKIAITEEERTKETSPEEIIRSGKAVLLEESSKIPENRITVIIEIKIEK